jgi:predicted anti-sigma-YlaC factor YlaD
MNCDYIKEWLTDNFTVAKIDPPDEIAAHLQQCPDCRAYAESLAALSAGLAPAAEMSMTEAESGMLLDAVDAAMQSVAVPERNARRKRRIFSIVRIATAVAAMVLIVMVSFRTNSVNSSYPLYNLDDFELTGTSAQDLAPLFVDGGSDLLPSMVDQQAVTYLTDQVDPIQAEDILESATSDEINWLIKNYSMEM